MSRISLLRFSLLLLALFALLATGCPSGSSDDGDVTGAVDAVGDTGSADLGGGDVGDDAGDAGPTGDVRDGVDIECKVVVLDGERDPSVGPIALTREDELAAYADSAGFQLDFGATLEGAAVGSRAVLKLDEEEAAAAAVVVDPMTGGGDVYFANVTVPHAPAGVAFSISILEGDKEVVSCGGILALDLGSCPVEVLPATDECLTEDADLAPGFQAVFKARSVGGDCDRASLIYQHGSDPIETPVVELDENGEAEFLLTLFPSAVSLNNEAVMVIAVAEDSVNPDREGQSDASVFTVDTQAPSIVIEHPAPGWISLLDDEDGNPGNGIQLAVRGTARGVSPSDGPALQLSVDGEYLNEAVVDASGSFVFPPVSFPSAGEYTIRVAASDQCGAEGSATVVVEAQTSAAAISCGVVSAEGEQDLSLVDVRFELDDEPSQYLESAGFQVDAHAVTRHVRAGALATLTLDGDWVAEATVEVDALTGVGDIWFREVTLPHAPEGVDFAITIVDGEEQVAACAAPLRVDFGLCPVELLPAPDACLTADEDGAPGFQRRFVVRSQGGRCDRAKVRYQHGSDPIETVSVALDEDGEASFLITLFATAVSLNNEAVLVTGIAMDSAYPSRTGESDPVVYNVDTDPPTVSITGPGHTTITMDDDADSDPSNGLQLVITGTAGGIVPADGSALTLSLDGTAVGQAIVDASGHFGFSAITFSSSGTYVVSVTADDSCGGHGEDSVVLQVETTVPTVAIVSPMDGETLWSRDDGDSTTLMSYESQLVIQAEDITPGTAVTLFCGRNEFGAPMLEVDAWSIDTLSPDNLYTFDVAFRADLLGPEQVCSVTTQGINSAESAQIRILVALPAPRIVLLAPDPDALVTDLEITVAGTAVNLDGSPLSVNLDDDSGALVFSTIASAPIADGAFAADIELMAGDLPLPDGLYRVWVDATDALGNIASEQPWSNASTTFVLDRTPPTLVFSWPPADGLNPAEDPRAADVDPAVPGHQADVVVEVQGELDPAGTEVCLGKDGVDLGCQTVAEGETSVTFAAVTMQPGSNQLVAFGRDAAGNAGEIVSFDARLILDAPRVDIQSPDGSIVTGDGTIDIVAFVSSDDVPDGIDGATVELLAGDAPSGIDPQARGGGVYAFVQVPLVSGENGFQVRASAGGTDGFSAPFVVTYKTEIPQLSFISPVGGSALNLSSEECSPASTDCVTVVSLSADALEDGSEVSLTVDCGAGGVLYEATVADAAVSFPDVTLTHGSLCSLSAHGTDAIGQPAAVGPISVSVDRVAPSIDSIDVPDVLRYDADLEPVEPGMQIDFALILDGVEIGQEVTVHVENEAGDSADYQLELPSGVPEGNSLRVSLGRVTLPEGFVEITAAVSDAAGNPSQTARMSAYVNSDVPDVQIVSPGRVPNDSCTASVQCASGGACTPDGCAWAWGAAGQFTAEVEFAGIAPGSDNLRICSNHASLALLPASPCATNGFFELVRADATTGPVQVSIESVLPEGFQVLIAEAEALPGEGEWVSSASSALEFRRERHVYVDTVLPEIAALLSPSDAEEPTDVLNIAEQAEDGRRYQIGVVASEDGVATVFVNGAERAEVAIVGGSGQAVIELEEGTNSLQARMEDIVGNASGMAPEAPFAVFVDTVPPALAFSYPEHSPIVSGQPLDVTLTTDAFNQDVTLYDGDPAVEIGTVAASAEGDVVFAHDTFAALGEGEHTLTAVVRDTANNPTSAATSPASVRVDTVAPSVAFSAPAPGALFVDADDAVPGQGGFQVDVGFTVSDGESWSLRLASGCDASFAGCGAPVEMAAGVADGNPVAQTITVPVAAESSYFVVSVSARDDVGNTQVEETQFTVQLTNCVVALEGLPAGGTYNNTMCAAEPGSDCDQVQAQLTVRYTLACVGADTVGLFRDGTGLASTTTIDNGTATFDVTFDHGEVFSLSARVFAADSAVGDSGDAPVRVDLHAPTPLFVEGDIDGFVTATSESTAYYGIADDRQPASADSAEVHALLAASDDGELIGGQLLALERVTGDETVALTPSNVTLPLDIAAAPIDIELRNLSLPVGGPHTVRATLRDRAGNLAETEFTANVDFTAPVVASIDLPDLLQWREDIGDAPGMQVELLVTLSGVDVDQHLLVSAVNELGDTESYDFTILEAVADGAPTQVAFGEITLPEGFVDISVDVSDRAGNPADTVTKSLYANSAVPSVRMQRPSWVRNDPCATNGDCGAGGICTAQGCALAWSASSNLSVGAGMLGIAPGADNFRVCSDHPSLVSEPTCATAGFRQIAVVSLVDAGVDVPIADVVPEGFQELIVEAETWAGNGEWISSADTADEGFRSRHVFIDTVAPTLVSLTSPSDTDAPVDVLNIAEQSSAGRNYLIRVEASEDGVAVLHVNGVQALPIDIVAGAAQTELTLREGANSIQVEVEDQVGNASGMAPASPYAPTVDTAAPTLAFSKPDHSPILAGQSRDVVLVSDTIGAVVDLYDGDPASLVGSQAVAADGTATFPHGSFGTLSDGDHRLTARVRDAALNETSAATSPALVQVDTVPPTLALTAPTQAALFVDGDDADASAGGFQVTVRFTPGGATTWVMDLASGCDASYAGCGVPVQLGTDVAGTVEIVRTITVPVSEATSHYVVGVQVSDALGNVTRQEVGFTVQLSNCVVSLDGIAAGGIYNNGLCATAGEDCAQVSASLTARFTLACVGTAQLALYKDDVQWVATADFANQTALFDVTMNHGEAFDLSARALASGGAEVGNSGANPVKVDLVDPVPVFVATPVDGFDAPASGDSVLYGIADDLQPASPTTGEINVHLSVTDDGGLAGGQVTTLTRTTGGSTVALSPSNVTLPQAIGAGSFAGDYKNLSLPDGGPHVVTATVADAAGNTATTTFDATEDLVAPGAVTLLPIASDDVNPRKPSVVMRWEAVDEGDGGAAASYDIRYSWQPITNEAEFEAACSASDLVPGTALPVPAAPTSLESFTLTGPDARSPLDPCRLMTSFDAQTLYTAVRAIDDAGNESPIAADSIKSTSAIQLRYATITHQNIPVHAWGDPTDLDRRVHAVGDLDGDGLAEIAIGGVWSNTICIVYGDGQGEDLTFLDYVIDGVERAGHICLADDTRLDGLGTFVSRPMDVNGDGLNDLVIGRGMQGGFGGGPYAPEVHVFLGRPAPAHISTTPDVVIRGMLTFQYIGIALANAGNFNGDISVEGNPVDDIVVVSDIEVGPEALETGAVYVIPGDEAWDETTSLVIDVTNGADREAWDIVRVALKDAEAVYDGATYVQPRFGYAVAGAGDLLPDNGDDTWGDGYDDIMVSTRIHDTAVYVIPGQATVGFTDLAVTDVGAVSSPTGYDATVLRLLPEFGVTANNFGQEMFGGVDVNGGGAPDLIVSHPSGSAEAPFYDLYIYWGEEVASYTTSAYTRVALLDPQEVVGDEMLRGVRGVVLPGSYQAPVLVGDFDDEGGSSSDLAYRMNSSTEWGEVFLRLNLALPAVSSERGYFPYADLVFEDPTGLGALSFGSSVSGVGDVNGDGFVDLLVGGGGAGMVYLIY